MIMSDLDELAAAVNSKRSTPRKASRLAPKPAPLSADAQKGVVCIVVICVVALFWIVGNLKKKDEVTETAPTKNHPQSSLLGGAAMGEGKYIDRAKAAKL